MALMPGKGLSKEAANYRPHERCGMCMHFYSSSTCDIVDGNIAPDAVCDHWELKPKNEPMDGESYLAEYRKKESQAQ